MPHRAPGSPGHSRKQFLSGKPIRYYRPKGSADIRAADRRRLSGVQRRPAVRGVPDLRGQDARARERHDDRPDDRRRDDAGRARRLRHRDDGSRPRRLHHLDRREPLSRSALRAEFHAAPRLAVLDDVELYEDGVIRIYDVLFPATVLLETDAYIRDFIVRSGLERADCDLGVPLPARPGPARAVSRDARSTRSWRAPRRPACRSTPRRPATARSA